MFRIFLVALALTAGGGAAWLALAWQPEVAPGTTIVQQAPQALMQEVLVASADLRQGQALDDANLRWQSWPEEALNSSFISRSARPDAVQSLKGSVVRSQIVTGEPISDDKLVRADSGFMSTILPSGKRAVAVRVSAENTAGGFIRPNDRVDVLQTVAQTGQSDGQNQSVSRTILTNIRVLAIDQKAGESDSAAAEIGKTATLELAPEQAELVAGAEASGLLSLALRSVADADESPTQARPSASTVRIVRAGVTEVVKVN